MIPLPSTVSALAPLAEALTAHSAQEQTNWMHGLSNREMKALWELAGPISITHFHAGEGQIIEHEGQNDLLPGFDRFEKHFVLRNGQVQGYNVSPWAFAVGPGHFILREDQAGTYVDYTTVPTDAPAGWPAIVKNEAGLSRFVYGNMKDFMRSVTDRMCIGRAYSADGKDKGHLFVMFRKG